MPGDEFPKGRSRRALYPDYERRPLVQRNCREKYARIAVGQLRTPVDGISCDSVYVFRPIFFYFPLTMTHSLDRRQLFAAAGGALAATAAVPAQRRPRSHRRALSVLPQHQHHPRPKMPLDRRDRDRRQGRLQRHRAVDRRHRRVSRRRQVAHDLAKRIADRPDRGKRHRLRPVDRGRRRRRAKGLEQAKPRHGPRQADRRHANRRPARRRDRPQRSEPAQGRRAVPQAVARSATRSASCRRSRCGAFPNASAAWAKRRWWPSRAATPRPASWPTSTTSTRAARTSAGLRLLGGAAVQVFHMNDYPADPPREKITDAHRVYPGDGVAPIADILRTSTRSASAARCRWSCSTDTTGARRPRGGQDRPGKNALPGPASAADPPA